MPRPFTPQTLAVSLWQPYASLIMAGLKRYEFRTWAPARQHHGREIVIHASKRSVDRAELAELLSDRERLWGSIGCVTENLAPARDMLERVWNGNITLPLGAGLGTVRLGVPRRAIDALRDQMDPDSINPAMWAWPVSDAQPFPNPIPARGSQGFWYWRPLPAPMTAKQASLL